ncbi:MAG: DegT/DnrJ/EryC1/StrS family aminotransferase, partial [Alphaproteobacteria bacterium]|nr:DegT/DnrJ/EryC1/StrS family aminotransferase [Alphaproteobacteria bacterium]
MMSNSLTETHDSALKNRSNTENSGVNLGENLATIGFAAPKQQYLAHKEEIDQAIARALVGDLYILGRETEQFEQEFADFCGVTYA